MPVSVTITSISNTNTNVSPIPIVITFADAVEGFNINDISIAGGEIIRFVANAGGSTYSADVIPSTHGESVVMQVLANVCTRIASPFDGNSASNILTRKYSTILPTATIQHSIDPISAEKRHFFQVQFSADVQFFTEDDFITENCTIEMTDGASESLYGGFVTATENGDYSFRVKNNSAIDIYGNKTSASNKVSLYYDNTETTERKIAATYSTFGEREGDLDILQGFTFGEVTQVAAIQSLADCAKDLSQRLMDKAIAKATEYIMNQPSVAGLLEKAALIQKNLEIATAIYDRINAYIENPKTLLMEVLEMQGLTGAALQAKQQAIADKFGDVVGLNDILANIDVLGICSSPDYYEGGAVAPGVMKNPIDVVPGNVPLPPAVSGATYDSVPRNEYNSFTFQLKQLYTPSGGEDGVTISMLSIVATLAMGYHDKIKVSLDNTKDEELERVFAAAAESERVRNAGWSPEVLNSYSTRIAEIRRMIKDHTDVIRKYFSRGNVIPSNGSFDSARAIAIAASDNASVGYCARGVGNVCAALGIGNFRGLNAHDFRPRFASEGWVKVEGATVETAPIGSILFFDSDVRLGKAARNKGGGLYGHVEIVAINAQGRRVYISDTARLRPGGSVPNNYGGAWARA